MKWIETKKYLEKLKLDEFPQVDIIELKYPVLLCHGYGGFSMLVKPSPVHDSCMRLRSYGIHAFAPNIVPYSTISVRAEQWAERVVQLQQHYGYEKMNVIAHSMGGLDMREAITNLGIDSSVASLTTIATPHHGTSLADIVLTAPDTLKGKLSEWMDWLGESIFPSSKSDATAAVEQLSCDYVRNEFNPNTPDIEGVKYFSVSAAVGKGTGHPLSPIYRPQNQLIYQREGLNDSFVTIESAIWGKHLETQPISHLEQIEIQVSKDRKSLVDEMWRNIALNLQHEGF
ncbi:MAG: alpha/beta fold hydrolase [Balneolaceae bacterium]|nr:alpha/beta fold hydrolase [Balneolaceae bacterium]MCH8550172.1 alpha/beta fold hydrolase [Balneolaceae bacterium]